MVFIVVNIDGKRVHGKGELLHWYYSVSWDTDVVTQICLLWRLISILHVSVCLLYRIVKLQWWWKIQILWRVFWTTQILCLDQEAAMKRFYFFSSCYIYFLFFLVYFPNEAQCALSLRTPSMPIRTIQAKQWEYSFHTY